MDKKSIKPLEELLDSVRDIDGFPIGEDEDILALSDPPFYTACPNPYIEEFIEEYGTPYDAENDDYHREPFVGDVSEGRSGFVYNAHPFHTKVPHKAIMKFIEHYSEKGDLIFDGFSGTGMTGIASQYTGRNCILSDIGIAATFISSNYNKKIDSEFLKEANELIKAVENECNWLYETNHISKNKLSDKQLKGTINYIIWSDVFICPYCNSEYVFFDVAIDNINGGVLSSYNCPSCDANLTKRESKRAYINILDNALQKEIEISKQVPVLINYFFRDKRYEKKPDLEDMALIDKIDKMEIPYWYPINRMPDGDESRRNDKYGIKYVHQFYTKRNLWVLSVFWENSSKSKEYKNLIRFLISSYNLSHSTKMSRVIFKKNNTKPILTGYQTGTLYIGSLPVEKNLIIGIRRKLENFKKLAKRKNNGKTIVSNNSITNLKNIPNNSIDYVFTDPPFGANLMYSELNFIWESWLKVFTNTHSEAIVNKTQDKALKDYKELMEFGFKEIYRILKPNRWITVEFHNSKASVWNAIQEALNRSGFIIAQVAVLDKQQGSFKQVNSAGAVKNDLIINAYKPEKKFSDSFIKNAGENMEVDFVKEQLEHIPISPNINRNEQILFSKTLAHYVENGFKIRYNSHNFYNLLSENFTELDGYWFLDSQVKEYNEWKSGLSLDQLKEVLNGQQVLIVSDERSALTWIYNFLNEPKDYSELYTAYQQVTTKSSDEIPELREILDNNFIIENGKYRRPLNQQEKEEINKNREKELDRAFEKLLNQAKTQKGKIKNIRREAMVHGFTKCYQEGRYQDILTIADKLYASTLESSGEIMDFIDIARIKTSGEE